MAVITFKILTNYEFAVSATSDANKKPDILQNI